jgi:hypothetical protein
MQLDAAYIKHEDMNMLVFRGTPEEFQQVAHLFAAPQPALEPKGMGGTGVTVNADTIVKALSHHKPLGPAHAALIDAVVAAYPRGIAAGELQARIPADLGALLGNIGRRLIAVGVPDRKATGERPSRWIISISPDPKTGEPTYHASEALIDAWRRYKDGKE